MHPSRHPLEEDVTLLDGRSVRIHGLLAVLWRNMEDKEKFLRLLAEWVDEYESS